MVEFMSFSFRGEKSELWSRWVLVAPIGFLIFYPLLYTMTQLYVNKKLRYFGGLCQKNEGISQEKCLSWQAKMTLSATDRKQRTGSPSRIPWDW